MGRHFLDLETLLKVPCVMPYYGFDLSPDEIQVAFSYNPSGRWEVYLMPLDGATTPRQITTGPGAKFSPRWSPAGQRLAYVLDLEGGERFDICVYDFATGQHINLTPDTPDAIQPRYAWSPASLEGEARIAFASDRSGRFDTYVMPATGGPAQPVLSLPTPDRAVHWSPDGRWLAVVSEGPGQECMTFIVPVEGGEPRPVADADGPIDARDVSWSPDSTRIAFSSGSRGFFDIGIYELETGQITWMTEGEGDKEQPTWSPDGRRLAYIFGQGPTTSLAVLTLEGGALATYQVEPGVHSSPRFTPDGEGLVFVFDSPHHPDDLWLLCLADGCFQQLTHSLPPELEGGFVMPTTVCYPSLDGRSVPALLYQPEHSEGLPPAVVYIHGGPQALTQIAWDPLLQHVLSRGWVVLAPNYRGSTGYGRKWQLANRFDLGGGDTKDVVAGTDYLAREGLADPARIAVTGESYGGYLTMTSLTQYPNRWAAGSAVVPFLNWFTEFASERQDLQHWDMENFGHPEKDRDLFYERSPFFFLDRITAPVQLVCGAYDPRCPASESIQARDALVAQGKVCDFVLYSDEGHGFLKTENVVDAAERQMAFLAGALEGA
jgi:dipeptidyl aminopeptidase/acylaminoacyl peptidase